MSANGPTLSKVRLGAIAALTVTALYVGGWATFGPRSFYDSFPGFHRIWVGVDGPYNEHLARDTGALYLGLAVAGMVVLVSRGYRESLVLAAAWATFSAPHFSYHVHHLGSFDIIDQVGHVVALGGTLLVSVALLAPPDVRGTGPHGPWGERAVRRDGSSFGVSHDDLATSPDVDLR